MSTILHGKIERGAIRPDVPLNLPEGETVCIRILPTKPPSPDDLTADDQKFLDELMRSRSESRIWNHGGDQ